MEISAKALREAAARCQHPERHRRILVDNGQEYYRFIMCEYCAATGKQQTEDSSIVWGVPGKHWEPKDRRKRRQIK